MPHATEETPITNGEMPKSKFLDHLQSYPVVSDSIETFKSYPIGKQSLEIANTAYSKFGKPVEPYLETPYSYAKPYANKADELADSALGHVDSTFPIVKDDTSTIVDKGKSLIWFPFKLAGDSTNYVLTTYNDEYTKTAQHKDRGPGLQTLVMALISTNLKITSDFFQAVADFLGPKYEESKKKGSDYVKKAQDTAEDYQKYGQDKLSELQGKAGEYQQKGEEKAGEYQKKGEEATEQTKQEAKKTKDEAQKKVQQK